MNQLKYRVYLTALLIFVFVYLFIFNPTVFDGDFGEKIKLCEQLDGAEILDFEGFDNRFKNDSDPYVVPDIVHLIFINQTVLKFYQANCIYSIFLNHNPKYIYIHCDPCNFTGYYWQQIKSIENLKQKIVIKKLKFQNTIFGLTGPYILYHKADVLRLLILSNYGGIYLDNDVYVANSLHKYRKYEMAIGWQKVNESIGNQVQIAHKNARFLKACFDSYRTNYHPDEWYYNGGYATAELAMKNREIVHLIEKTLDCDELIDVLFKTYKPNWHDIDWYHLLYNISPIKDFDEINIETCNCTYGEMARDVLHRIKPYMLHSRSKK